MREKVKRSRPSFAPSAPVRRIPPSKKVLDERRPPAPWILLTEDPEPSPAPPEGGAEQAQARGEGYRD